MIIEMFVKFVFGILTWLLSLVPHIVLPSLDFGPAVGLMQQLDVGLPITPTLQMVGLFLTVTGALFALQVIRALIKHVPFVGG